ncbi:MAG TPA: NADH-quinone oxidoreductase subunit C [Candidatus Dormibacteraeota bacterium]|nr:NADH-quinone oxidoreductase subunit C [Candidatus Dormibacteraeota bacterium]
MANDPSEKTPAPKPPADPPKAAAEGPSVPPKPPAEGAAATPPTSAAPPKPAAPAKPAAPGAPAAAAPPKPAAPPPPKEGPTPLDNELVQRLKSRFGDAIKEATQDRKQAIVLVAADKLREISRYCRDDEKFDMLDDLTAVDWPKREKRFDVVLILYSFPKNERLRLKAHLGENEPVPSMCEVWPVANWLERECYDMFGIVFDGHPDLKRILLPDEWQGHPLRKDYDILKQDTDWVRENLGIESGQ